MPYVTTQRGWKGLGAADAGLEAQLKFWQEQERIASANYNANPSMWMGPLSQAQQMILSIGQKINGNLPSGTQLTTPQGWVITTGTNAQSNPIKTTGDSTTKPSPFASLTDLFKSITGSDGGDVLPQAPRGPVIAPNLLAQQQPAPSSGLPGWVLPVGIGVVALGVVAFLVTRKRK